MIKRILECRVKGDGCGPGFPIMTRNLWLHVSVKVFDNPRVVHGKTDLDPVDVGFKHPRVLAQDFGDF